VEGPRPLIELTEHDRQVYAERLRDFLPEEIVDVHTHVWRASDFPPSAPAAGPSRTVSWPALVANENPLGDLLETYRVLLPGKRVTPLIFPMVPEGGNLEVQNRYVADCARQAQLPALIFSDPAWSAAQLEERVASGGFLGAKSYLTLAPAHLSADDISIFDFFPPHQLEVHDRHGWIVMLHIPRAARLKDPLNLVELLRLERDYPNLTLIVAHVGRAYSDEDVGDAFEVLAGTERMCFDLSANTNDDVFEGILRAVGPQRVLFGSDLPITRMRMRRLAREGRYVNLVPQGLYGDVSGDKNMEEIEGPEAARLTLFLYEELEALRRAAERVGLTRQEVEDVCCHNARRVLAKARGASATR
jgi:predicted TIM-barrel fold metal-dependent hydrolase